MKTDQVTLLTAVIKMFENFKNVEMNYYEEDLFESESLRDTAYEMAQAALEDHINRIKLYQTSKGGWEMRKLIKPAYEDPDNSVDLFDADRKNEFGEKYCVAPAILLREADGIWNDYLMAMLELG